MTNAGGRRNTSIGSIVVKALILLLLLVEVYPIVWLLLSSLKGPAEFSVRPMYALPEGFYWKNYVDAWNTGHMDIYFRNSVLVTFPSLLVSMVLSASAAFAIEKMKWKWNNRILLLFLGGIMIPIPIVLLPLFTMYLKVNLVNNLWGLIITYTAFGLPLQTFLFSGYFKAMPNEVLESAVIDGASIYQIFARIAVPMIKNSIVTVGLVQFFFTWNDLILSMTFINDDNLRTIQTGLINFQGEYGQTMWGPTFASISMAVIPTVLLYLFLNRSVMKGLTSGAVKG